MRNNVWLHSGLTPQSVKLSVEAKISANLGIVGYVSALEFILRCVFLLPVSYALQISASEKITSLHMHILEKQ